VIYSTYPSFCRITRKNVERILRNMSLYILPLIIKVKSVPQSNDYPNHVGTTVLTHEYFQTLKIFQKRNFYASRYDLFVLLGLFIE
jgi:hypothetical protein